MRWTNERASQSGRKKEEKARVGEREWERGRVRKKLGAILAPRGFAIRTHAGRLAGRSADQSASQPASNAGSRFAPKDDALWSIALSNAFLDAKAATSVPTAQRRFARRRRRHAPGRGLPGNQRSPVRRGNPPPAACIKGRAELVYARPRGIERARARAHLRWFRATWDCFVSASETGERVELNGLRCTHAHDARACRTAVTGENDQRQDCLKKKSSAKLCCWAPWHRRAPRGDQVLCYVYSAFIRKGERAREKERERERSSAPEPTVASVQRESRGNPEYKITI